MVGGERMGRVIGRSVGDRREIFGRAAGVICDVVWTTVESAVFEVETLFLRVPL